MTFLLHYFYPCLTSSNRNLTQRLLYIHQRSLERLRSVIQETTDLTKKMTAIRSELSHGKINQSEYDFRITGKHPFGRIPSH